jgi:hypothetical protein
MKLFLLIICLMLQSCVSDDFNNVANGFAPLTPHDAAIMASNSYDSNARRKGLTLLSNSPFGGAPEYLLLYRDYIEHDLDPLVRASAIKALARFGNSNDAMLIAPWLDMSLTESVQVRRAAGSALQRLHNPEVVPTLLRSLRNQDEENQVRTAVAIALGQYPEKRVYNGLIFGLRAINLSINLASAQSLHMLTGQVFGTDWDEWYDWGKLVEDAGDSLFAFQSSYEYPTYQHQARWWDRVTFWEYRIHESPDYPAGLKEVNVKSTYDDDVETSQ